MSEKTIDYGKDVVTVQLSVNDIFSLRVFQGSDLVLVFAVGLSQLLH